MSDSYHGKHRLEDTEIGGLDEDWVEELKKMNQEDKNKNKNND